MLNVTEAVAAAVVAMVAVADADAAMVASMHTLVASVPDQCGRFCSVQTAEPAQFLLRMESSAQQWRWMPTPRLTW